MTFIITDLPLDLGSETRNTSEYFPDPMCSTFIEARRGFFSEEGIIFMYSPSPSRSPRRSRSPKSVSIGTSSLDRMIPTSIGPSTLEAAASILEKKARRSHSPKRRSPSSRSPARSPARSRSPKRRISEQEMHDRVVAELSRRRSGRSPSPRYLSRHAVTPSVTPSM
jgi:hypothetical protein